MINNRSYSEQDNDWAKNIEGNPIHISLAESGAKGYYCMGCGKEMQAVKRIKNNYKSYFRHHVKDVDNSKVECVHASRVYREKLAFFYFMRAKQIIVPAVYKYPPKGVDGSPYLLQEKETINAHRIDREVTIFEDEEGIIHWGNKDKVDERFLWIRPDAVFYDKEDKPILLLEFVVTHKPDIDKLNKLQRLGINTVQIIVPKISEAELEKELCKPSKVKWTYNEIESNTAYISVPEGSTEGISSLDDIQRRLFEESFACRRAQVENLLRSISRCLESQSYRRTEQHFEQEIQRIEKASREHQSRLDEIQDGIEREIYSELGDRRKELDSRREKFRKYSSGLEARYIKKRGEVIEEYFSTNREIDFRERGGRTERGVREDFERKRREIEFRQRTGGTSHGIRDDFERKTRKIELEESNVDREQGIIGREVESIDINIKENSTFENSFTRTKQTSREEYEAIEQSTRNSIEGLREKYNSKDEDFRIAKIEMENGVRSYFEGQYCKVIERINKRDVQTGGELSERIKSILELRGLFDSYSDGESTIAKYRKGIQIIKNGTWKEWN